MKEVDQLLEDAALVESVYDAQGKRHPNNRTRGTHTNTGGSGTSAADLEACAELELRHIGTRSTKRTWYIARSPALETRKYRMPRR